VIDMVSMKRTNLKEDSRIHSISAVIPTYGREQVLLETIHHLLNLHECPDEILIIDQTADYVPAIREQLQAWHDAGAIRWLRLPVPSITHAMNVGLLEASGDVVLFLDDDIITAPGLITAHRNAHVADESRIIAGQVLQPGEEPSSDDVFSFRSTRKQWVEELMGGNFSVHRKTALRLGGFDENFVQVAYRFEAEFCDRARLAGEKILFEPAASIRHLKAASGGTRSFGHHLRTARPGHSVGAYYFLLRARLVRNRWQQLFLRPFRAISTRHHLRRPWWIPVTLLAELTGMAWAVRLYHSGPRLLRPNMFQDKLC